MTERPILFSIITGKQSQKGKNLKSIDGLTWRQRNREAVNARKRALYALNPKKYHERSSAYRKTHKEKVNKLTAKYGFYDRAKIRAEMILAYGSKCVCCGESEPKFLQLDHVFNDGRKERKIYRTSTVLWKALKKQGWPKDRYQLLCANCNFGKLLNSGICPHKTKAVACA